MAMVKAMAMAMASRIVVGFLLLLRNATTPCLQFENTIGVKASFVSSVW
jgi:hypothetical protein